jgi:hypothetical protein
MLTWLVNFRQSCTHDVEDSCCANLLALSCSWIILILHTKLITYDFSYSNKNKNKFYPQITACEWERCKSMRKRLETSDTEQNTFENICGGRSCFIRRTVLSPLRALCNRCLTPSNITTLSPRTPFRACSNKQTGPRFSWKMGLSKKFA